MHVAARSIVWACVAALGAACSDDAPGDARREAHERASATAREPAPEDEPRTPTSQPARTDSEAALAALEAAVREAATSDDESLTLPPELSYLEDRLTEADRRAIAASIRWSRGLSDEQLREIARQSHQAERGAMRWVLVRLLLDRARPDDAAGIVLADAIEKPKDASYRFLKWLEFGYGEHPNGEQITRSLGRALVQRFERGTPNERRAVIALFDRDDLAIEMTATQLRQKLGL